MMVIIQGLLSPELAREHFGYLQHRKAKNLQHTVADQETVLPRPIDYIDSLYNVNFR